MLVLAMGACNLVSAKEKLGLLQVWLAFPLVREAGLARCHGNPENSRELGGFVRHSLSSLIARPFLRTILHQYLESSISRVIVYLLHFNTTDRLDSKRMTGARLVGLDLHPDAVVARPKL